MNLNALYLFATLILAVSCSQSQTGSTVSPQCEIVGLCLVSSKFSTDIFPMILEYNIYICYYLHKGQILTLETSEDKITCWSLCESIDGCAWFSFDIGLQTCILLKDCPEIESNHQFVSGQKECDYGGYQSIIILYSKLI